MRSLRVGCSTVLPSALSSCYAACRIPLTARPHQVCPPILSLFKVRHDTVHDVWLRGEEVDSVDIAISLAAVGDLFDVWSKSGEAAEKKQDVWASRTRDVLVQNGVFFEDVIY